MSVWATGAGALALMWLLSRRRSKATPKPGVRRAGRPKGLKIRAGGKPTIPTPGLPTPTPGPEPDPVDILAEIQDLLNEFISDEPRPGFFYQIQKDDSLSAITRKALNTISSHSNQARLSYIHCLSSGPQWNMRLYGTPSYAPKTYPKYFLVPGKNTGVRAAFFPRNADAHALMLQGIEPDMTVNPTTGKSLGEGSSWGLLWLPPVDGDSLAAGEPTCAPFNWDQDGSSTIDPPPQLLDLLQ